ncbi:RidA family protein, partial [Streptomyces jumonjinensis]
MATIDVFHHNVSAESDFGYSQAIRSGELIHVSGQLSLDEAGAFLHADDFAAQLQQTHANTDKVLD